MDNEKKILKQFCIRALKEFEDVKAQAKEYNEKFCKEEGKRLHLEEQFKHLKQVSLLAVTEYESLHKQYIDENKYREEIGKKLHEVELENAEIRKSCSNTSIFTQFQNEHPGTKAEVEVLRSMRDGLNDELRNTRNELAKVKSELRNERSKNSLTATPLTTTGGQMKQLNRVSSLVLGEFANLKKKVEIESDYRQKAEEAEKKKVTEEEKRKDGKIKALLLQIDEIRKGVEKEKKESATKINELEEELKNLTATTKEKISILTDQLDIAQQRLTESESRANKSELEVRNLYTRLALSEKVVQTQSKAVPPPPPPPPPPPLAGPVLRKFISKISGCRRKKKLPGDLKTDDPQAKAMDDVVNKIKEGVKLRSVATHIRSDHGINVDEDSAMGELAGLLSSFRRNTKPSFNVVCKSEVNDISLFGARRSLKKPNLKVNYGNSMDVSDDGPSSELRVKLLKQKCIADGFRKENDGDDKMIYPIVEEGNLETENQTRVEYSGDVKPSLHSVDIKSGDS